MASLAVVCSGAHTTKEMPPSAPTEPDSRLFTTRTPGLGQASRRLVTNQIPKWSNVIVVKFTEW